MQRMRHSEIETSLSRCPKLRTVKVRRHRGADSKRFLRNGYRDEANFHARHPDVEGHVLVAGGNSPAGGEGPLRGNGQKNDLLEVSNRPVLHARVLLQRYVRQRGGPCDERVSNDIVIHRRQNHRFLGKERYWGAGERVNDEGVELSGTFF